MCDHPLSTLDTVESVSPERVKTELYCPICDIVVAIFVATVNRDGTLDHTEWIL